MIDIPGLTPEQEAAVAKKLADAKVAAKKEYDAEAHKFREWLNTHSAVWAAQRVGTVVAILATGFGWWLHSIWSLIGK